LVDLEKGSLAGVAGDFGSVAEAGEYPYYPDHRTHGFIMRAASPAPGGWLVAVGYFKEEVIERGCYDRLLVTERCLIRRFASRILEVSTTGQVRKIEDLER
jgi:hypothetical protein